MSESRRETVSRVHHENLLYPIHSTENMTHDRSYGR